MEKYPNVSFGQNKFMRQRFSELFLQDKRLAALAKCSAHVLPPSKWLTYLQNFIK